MSILRRCRGVRGVPRACTTPWASQCRVSEQAVANPDWQQLEVAELSKGEDVFSHCGALAVGIVEQLSFGAAVAASCDEILKVGSAESDDAGVALEG